MAPKTALTVSPMTAGTMTLMPTNDDLAYQDEAYGGDDGDEAAEDAWEHEGHVRTTMGVLNTFSVLLGVFVIFVLVAMLLGLFSWLKADILHSLTLLEGGIR